MAKGMIRAFLQMAAILMAGGQGRKSNEMKTKAASLSNPGFNGFYAPYPQKEKNQRQKRKAWRQSNASRRKQSKRAD